MKIPFRQHRLVIELEATVPTPGREVALEGASDREVERFARTARMNREPRWETQALIYGFHM